MPKIAFSRALNEGEMLYQFDLTGAGRYKGRDHWRWVAHYKCRSKFTQFWKVLAFAIALKPNTGQKRARIYGAFHLVKLSPETVSMSNGPLI